MCIYVCLYIFLYIIMLTTAAEFALCMFVLLLEGIKYKAGWTVGRTRRPAKRIEAGAARTDSDALS